MLGINLAVYAFMLFGGVVVLAFGVLRGANAVRLGVGPTSQIAGAIFDKTVDDGADDLWYSFTPPGQALVVGDVPVSSEEWATARVGSKVSVEFLTVDVSVNWLTGHSPFAGEAEAGAFGLAMGVFVLLVVQFRYAPPNLRFPWRRSAWRL
jgi:hypothetical protein